MIHGELVVVENVASAFASTVAEVFANRANPDQFVLALSGGSTATACYEALVDAAIDWSLVTIVWGDERCVPPDHEDSNYLLADKALLSKVGTIGAVYRMDCTEGAPAYEDIVRGLLPIDVTHLGMGDDGHTASLFPGSPSLQAPEQQLVLETGDDLHPHPRMTLTFSAIAQSRLALFTVTGANKADMFKQVEAGGDFPAAHVTAEKVIWLVDPSTASRR